MGKLGPVAKCNTIQEVSRPENLRRLGLSQRKTPFLTTQKFTPSPTRERSVRGKRFASSYHRGKFTWRLSSVSLCSVHVRVCRPTFFSWERQCCPQAVRDPPSGSVSRPLLLMSSWKWDVSAGPGGREFAGPPKTPEGVSPAATRLPSGEMSPRRWAIASQHRTQSALSAVPGLFHSEEARACTSEP